MTMSSGGPRCHSVCTGMSSAIPDISTIPCGSSFCAWLVFVGGPVSSSGGDAFSFRSSCCSISALARSAHSFLSALLACVGFHDLFSEEQAGHGLIPWFRQAFLNSVRPASAAQQVDCVRLKATQRGAVKVSILHAV